MEASRYLVRVASLAAALALAAAAATASSAAAASTHFTGTLADGATWIADVPSDWNGMLLLYSHGFGPLIAADAPDPASAAALLARGYALAGSSYDPNGSWWALQSAVRDQFQTIDAATANALPHAPNRVLAVGSSMGGLDQRARGASRAPVTSTARSRRAESSPAGSSSTTTSSTAST